MRIPDRWTGCLAAVLMVVGLPAMASGDDLPSPMRLLDLLAAVRRNNPELAERRELARAGAARPRGAAQLDDPMVSVEWWQQPINFASYPIMLTLRQPLPWPGKLRSRRDVADREAATARDQVGETQRRLEAAAKHAFFDLGFAESSLAVNQRVQTLLSAMVTAVDAKYKVGKAAQSEILRAQSELLTVANDRLDLERTRDEARARLNALLDRDGDAALPPIAFVASRVTLPDRPELVRCAVEHRPDVLVARDALAEAEARLGVARRENNPELAVWAGYMVNLRGIDTFTTGVSTTLPIFSSRKRSALVDAGQAEVQAKRAALAAARRRADSEIQSALLQIEAAQRHARLHADKLIPLAELELQSAEAAYQNDRITFFAVLDAARMVRDHHLNHERYLFEYERRLADLELAIGEDLEREVAR